MIYHDLESFKLGLFCVRCKTQEEADNFLNYLDENNITWRGGAKISEESTEWNKNKDKTVYCYTKDIKGVGYGSIYNTYLADNNIDIIYYEEFIKPIKKKSNKR